ncbi:ethanolamine ammonia-lyase subunit EutC [uncultured Cohaesibacter sp.]|uniref:ethanolamine ammonia-lyase subunit EutC n=1 Tax=uncultured Cohaesibacter sp. TaxID=1002546 RepID=UPI002AABA00F|nr:ethanolamine ammonia-lyase subunit EutC [uncultured Cohaesibacter sp.]
MKKNVTVSQLDTQLRKMTAARVALGRSGSGLPTVASLAFALDHARAREAVWSDMDKTSLRKALDLWPLASVSSAAPDRSSYIRRPDLGRKLAPDTDLSILPREGIIIVIADGLSATAVNANAIEVVTHLQSLLPDPAGIVLAERGRVAIGDEIGATVQAKAVVVLIGERPGLSSADSLGAYITWAPEQGLPDSRRNCISNIRDGGLAPEDAAKRIGSLLQRMERAQISGVALGSTVAENVALADPHSEGVGNGSTKPS